MLELSMSKHEKFGVPEQKKVMRVLAIQKYVREIELCPKINGLLDSPLLGDGPDPIQKGDECTDELIEDKCERSEEFVCMHCVAHIERHDIITALPSMLSVHIFHFDPEIDMEQIVPGCSAAQFCSYVEPVCLWLYGIGV
uniref:Uncharacterized protein n=1 Tax=Arundo donax TaxID=35708 RepID=A0A0A9CFD3_ARUDO